MAQLLRSHQRVKRGAGQLSKNDGITALLQIAAKGRDPAESAASHEFLAALEQAITQLPQLQRTAIRLRYIEGLALNETASKMGLSNRSVDRLCARSLKILRDELAKGFDEPTRPLGLAPSTTPASVSSESLRFTHVDRALGLIVDSSVDQELLLGFLFELAGLYAELSGGDQLVIRGGLVPAEVEVAV
jgi:hypothetical protein